MAGCTDLYVSLNFGTLKETRFLNLWRLDALRTIEMRGGLLSIGALATYTDLIRSPLVRRRVPMLAAAAREVGGVQIQNRGTIGGNVANASPAGDTLPVLAAADAIVVLRAPPARGASPFTAFYTGYRADGSPSRRADRRVRDPGDSRPAVVPEGRHARGAGDLEGRDGRAVRPPRIGRARIALGSVAPTVVRARRTEAALAAGASIDEAQRTLAGRDRADRRHPLDRRLSPPRRGQSARAVSGTTRPSQVE